MTETARLPIERRELPLDVLFIDRDYQRPVDDRRVGKIVAAYDPRRMNVLEVSSRGDGTYAVFDGQHRLYAARELALPQVFCTVHYGLSPQQEAALFVSLQNDRKSVLPVDRFKAAVHSGDEQAAAIDLVLAGCSMSIIERPGSTRLTCVGVIESIYKRYGAEHLRYTLDFVQELWEGSPKVHRGSFIAAVASLLDTYGHRIKANHKDYLQRYSPATYIRDAQAEGVGGGMGGAAPRITEQMRKRAKLRRIVDAPQAKAPAGDLVPA